MGYKRRILFVSSNFPPVIGGSATVYDQICTRLAPDVVALSSGTSLWGEVWPKDMRKDNERKYIMHRLTALQPAEGSENRTRWEILLERVTNDAPIMSRTLLYITWLILRYRVEVVCLGELVGLGWLVLPLRYVLGRRVIIYTHGEEITNASEWMLNRLRPMFLRHASAVVAVSNFCKGQIIARFGIDANKITIVRNGVDLELFRPGEMDRSALPESIRDRTIVLAVGRLVARKGQDALIRAMPEVIRRVPKAHCVIVGDGPLQSGLEDLSHECNIGSRCTFISGISTRDLAVLYRSCDVFVLPCHTLENGDTEGFGLVFLEASACGVPVVAGAAGGTIEAVDHGKSGLLVNGSSHAEIAQAICAILSDRALAKNLGSGGIRWAAAHSWEKAVGTFWNVCQESRKAEPAYPSIMASMGRSSEGVRPRSSPALLVTMDVEEEFEWRQFNRDGYLVRGLEALTAFHTSCNAIGVRPVYFVSWPILHAAAFVEFFKNVLIEDTGEVGIHLHSWVTPPFWEEPNVFTSYQCNLPEHVERRKLEVLCSKFEDALGQKATIHRAGRWGGSERTSNLLAEQGIYIDFSPVARDVDRDHVSPNFSNIEGQPFWSGSNRDVLTLPLSAVTGLRGPDWMSSGYFRVGRTELGRRLERVSNLAAPIRFCPEAVSKEMLFKVAKEIEQRKFPVAVFGLHSTSLYAGGNPFARNAVEASAVHDRAISVIDECLSQGIFVPSTAAEVFREFEDLAFPARPGRATEERLAPALTG